MKLMVVLATGPLIAGKLNFNSIVCQVIKNILSFISCMFQNIPQSLT